MKSIVAASEVADRLLLAIDVQRAQWTVAREPIYAAIAAAATRYRRTVATVFVSERQLQYIEWTPDEAKGLSVDPRLMQYPRLVKTTYAVDPRLINNELQEHSLAGVDIAGFDTDVAVLGTTRHLAATGVDVRVRADLCAGIYHKEALRLLRRGDIGNERIITEP